MFGEVEQTWAPCEQQWEGSKRWALAWDFCVTSHRMPRHKQEAVLSDIRAAVGDGADTGQEDGARSRVLLLMPAEAMDTATCPADVPQWKGNASRGGR
jgi:hypothetical protein